MKTLLVAPSWIGDMVMAHSLIRLLVEDQGDTVDLLAPPATAPLGERLPGVRRTLVLPIGHGELGLLRRRRCGRALRPERYQRAIVLPNTFKSALVPWWARIPRRTGWRGEQRYGLLNDLRHLNADRYPRMVDRFLALGLPPGAALPDPWPAPRLQADQAVAAALAARLGLDAARPVLGLCPGAEYGAAKRWPPAHFGAVAAHYVERGGDVWLFGSAADAPVTGAVCDALAPALAARVHDLAGRTTLGEAVDLLSLTRHVVTNDSGLMHVAGALGRPVIAVFGSTSPAFTPPLGPDAVVLRLGLDCSPCFARECPLGHRRCLTELPPGDVIARLEAPG